MPAIILPDRWRRQPFSGGRLQLAESSAFANGIVLAYTPTGRENAALSTPLIYSPTLIGGTLHGLAIVGSGATSYAKFAATDTQITGSYTSYSLSNLATEWSPSSVFSQGVAYNSTWSIRYYVGGGTGYVIAPGIGLDVSIGSGKPLGPTRVAFSVESGATNGAKVWWNGSNVHTTTGTPTSLSGSRSMLVARSEDVAGSTNQAGGVGVSLSLAWNRALNDEEIKELDKNPWQIFRKQSRVYFLPSAGGGGATLTVQDLTQGQSLGVPSLTEHNVLAANALSQAQSLEAPSLTQHGLLAVDALGQAHSLGEPGLTQAHVLVAQDVAQTHTLGEPSLTQAHVLIVQAIGQDQSLGEPALTQHNVLVVDALGQSQVLEAPSLTAAGTLAVDALAQAQSFGLPAIVQHHVLAVDALAQTQAFGSPSLTQAHILTPDALAQAQTTGNVSFTIAASLAVQAIVQAQAFGSPDLTQHHVLTPDAIVQAQQLAEAALTQHGSLAVDGMTQAQALDALALTQHYAIIVQSLLQGHELGTSSLTANDVLTVVGITQAQLLEIPGLTQHAVLAVDGLTQAQILGLVGIGGAIIGIDGGTIVCFQRLGGRIVASRLGPSIVAATLH